MAFYRLDDAPVRMVLDLGLTHPGHITPVATPSPCRHRQIRHTLGSVVLAKGSVSGTYPRAEPNPPVKPGPALAGNCLRQVSLKGGVSSDVFSRQERNCRVHDPWSHRPWQPSYAAKV